MDMEYYLWHTSLQGWYSTNGSYGTRLSYAKKFSKSAAMRVVNENRTDEALKVIPVRVEDVTP